ncbi:MAG TPA: CHAD domain-containing protein [Xanthobacteraceae bacterium]
MRGKAGVRPDVRVGEALAGAARDILHEARDALDDRARPDAAAVHQYRKDMKRWRAMLRLLAPFLGPDGEGLQRQARDLARELAPARDAQAALDALADLGKAEPGLPAAVTKALRGRIEKLRANETTALDDGVRQKLGGALDAAELAAEHWPVDRVGFAELAAALAAGYRRARKAVPPDFSAASAEKLHDLRKRVIVHRYQIELVAPLWPRMTKAWIAEAQRLRERLGHHHDLGVLDGLTAAGRPLARWRARLKPAIAARQATHVAAAAKIAARLFAEKPRAFRKRLEALMSGNR